MCNCPLGMSSKIAFVLPSLGIYQNLTEEVCLVLHPLPISLLLQRQDEKVHVPFVVVCVIAMPLSQHLNFNKIVKEFHYGTKRNLDYQKRCVLLRVRMTGLTKWKSQA